MALILWQISLMSEQRVVLGGASGLIKWRHYVKNCLGFLALGASLAFAAPLRAQDAAWRIDPNHSAAHFSVRHLMISTVRGEFSGVNGTVRYDPKRPAEASVEATIDCRTLNTGVAKRDEQMKGPDFFDVQRYPSMKFTSKRVQAAGKGKLKITGDLTINAITRQVVLDVEGPSPPVKDAQGREKIGLSAATRINRKDFAITWNEILESGGVAVADEVSISLDIELIRLTAGQN
ncbi:MAG TPA: YceI family protein [Bryobacteraceae bacterium]|nr:YceI family protein [Bryobacteraceae bacterium]